MNRVAWGVWAFVGAALWASAASAVTMTFIEVRSGNDPFPTDITYEDSDSQALLKFDCIGPEGNCVWTEVDAGATNYTDNFSFTFDDSKSGTWSFLADASELVPLYVAVKGGSDYALYTVSCGDGCTYEWDTNQLSAGPGNHPDLSHMSFYDSLPSDEVLPPVPLPAALPLFGSALVGAGLLGWRKRRKAS